ncbi:hypothetical protein A5766_15500 [Gordonia sp. 852002-51296_SCH5728562-b]|nr:hypothetical protein A5766_15500 [Gordonia sp. 852002-51296_SCH5728562-b]
MCASQPPSGYVAQVIRAAVDVLPIALGLLMASAPLVMVSMALVIRRSVGAGWSFLLGWILGLVIVCGVVVAVADLVSLAGETGTVGGVVGVVVGVILLGLGVWKWYGEWRNPNKGDVPSWYESIERMRGSTVFAFGIGMAALNPKTSSSLSRPVSPSPRRRTTSALRPSESSCSSSSAVSEWPHPPWQRSWQGTARERRWRGSTR